ncbi:hypothetical protein BH10ACI4_BH10ACI4_34200 [soil metagenome]
MQQDLQNTFALLTRTPATLDALLRDLPEAWTSANEGPETWAIHDVIAHMNHCERVDWMRRATIIVNAGETQPFRPLDRAAHTEESQGKSLNQLLDAFSELRAENLKALQALNLQAADLERRGLHPAFGPVTLSQLLATWATHDLTHLHQISRILAHQYREAVGPWNAYLGVLRCTGHSSS